MIIKIPDCVQKAMDLLKQNSKECFAVGGCVRDSVLGNTPNDWDLTTDALPYEIKEIFKNYRIIESGIKHGTAGVIISDEIIEITTYRQDGNYTDNRHPDSVRFSADIEDDLARRDFTVNAVAYNPDSGIVDKFGGLADINNKIIRCVGNPDDRFKEDALRIFRCIRFASVLGFKIEENTEQALFRNKELLKNIAKERISSELLKLLTGKNVFEVLSKYGEILAVVIPDLKSQFGFKQYGKKHAYTVWLHTCHTVANIENDEILRLTMLLHDCGKPLTHKTDENGNSTFENHACEGGKIAKKILTDLKFGKNTVDTVSFLVSIHDMKVPDTKIKIKQYLNLTGNENFIRLMKIRKADRSGLADGYNDISALLDKMYALYNEVISYNEPYNISMLAVNGTDLMNIGINGEKIGETLKMLTAYVTEHPEKNEKKILTDFAKEFCYENGNQS